MTPGLCELVGGGVGGLATGDQPRARCWVVGSPALVNPASVHLPATVSGALWRREGEQAGYSFGPG